MFVVFFLNLFITQHAPLHSKITCFYLAFTSNIQKIPYLAICKYKNTGNVSINVTLRRVCVTTTAVEKEEVLRIASVSVSVCMCGVCGVCVCGVCAVVCVCGVCGVCVCVVCAWCVCVCMCGVSVCVCGVCACGVCVWCVCV